MHTSARYISALSTFAIVAALASATASAAGGPSTTVAGEVPLGGIVAPIEGYVWGWQPANANYIAATGYEYNSAGGAVQIMRPAAGTYQVRFLGMAGTGGIAHVSAYGGSNICTVSSWGPSLGDEIVNVRCFTPAGAAIDARFVAHVSNRTDGTSRGYLWSSDPTPPAAGYTPPATWSYDSAGQPIVVSSSGVGHYEVELGAFAQDSAGAWASGALRVTAYGTSPVVCQVFDPTLFADPDVLRVRCYDTAGMSVNTKFALSYTRDVVPVSATIDNYALVPAIVGWSSPSGVAPTATVIDDGDYLISFPGAGAAGGHAFAGLVATPPFFCNIQYWTVIAGALTIRVRCYEPGSGAANPAMLINVGFLA